MRAQRKSETTVLRSSVTNKMRATLCKKKVSNFQSDQCVSISAFEYFNGDALRH